MAATRPKTQVAIGSTHWIQSEREQITTLIDQEVEEFGFSARNELEWLNEHMADVFSCQAKTLTEVFKTPGKLRGKTPRTARKKDPQRAPLTDLFAPNPQAFTSPARSTPFFQKVSKLQVAADEQPRPGVSAGEKEVPRAGKENTDSGYHGMTEDEMDLDAPASSATASDQAPVNTHLSAVQESISVDHRSTQDSFVSAAEAPLPPPKDLPLGKGAETDDATISDEDMHNARMAMNDHVDGQRLDPGISIHEDMADEANDAAAAGERTPRAENESLSETSSPDKPVVRKSSLNFASLPPRETLTGKRSMGDRRSGTRASNMQPSHTTIAQAQDVEAEGSKPILDATAAYNKTSTQLLHERINMLGQARESRTSKSLLTAYPVLPSNTAKLEDLPATNDDDDEWIAPISHRSSDETERPTEDNESDRLSPARRMLGHQKSISTMTLASPAKLEMAPEGMRQKSNSVSAPKVEVAPPSTPAASPKKQTDGPLSASKARLYSMLKSAKGMFAASAGASAHAKVQVSAIPPSPSKQTITSETLKMPGGFADDTASTHTNNSTTSRPLSAVFSPKKTRSSSGSDGKKSRDTKAETKAANDLDKARAKERHRAAQQKEERERSQQMKLQRQQKAPEEHAEEDNAATRAMEPVPSEVAQDSKGAQSASKMRAPGRLAKPTRQAPPTLVRPVPVNIRVASQSQRLGSVHPSGSSNAVDDVVPPNRPPSAAGRTGAPRAGATSAASNARVKALEAAARKKEREELAAAKKAEQKREFERKRAAKLEDDRRAEQERKAEAERKAQEARMVAQKQAEQRLAEQKRLEQQRREAAAMAAKVKAEAELADALERERAKAQQTTISRSDVPSTIRQLNKQEVPVKNTGPAKRPLQRDGDESMRPGAFGRAMPTYQQHEAKRRRTNDEDDADIRERHSVMAPPKRPSNMRKETISKFPHGYAHAPPPAAHRAQSIYKGSIATQPIQANKSVPMQPHETIKVSTARIPFADNPNPPMSHAEPSTAKTPTATTFKTPARPVQHGYPQSTRTKSSPAFPNGDNIALPEINTDSEDESDESDSDATPGTKRNGGAGQQQGQGGFRAPSWVASPALRDLLTQQQLVDPESVFGPIATLNMDEVFRAGSNKEKERLRRYRERGESAMWVESGDAVTSAEKRRDREARERVVRDGGWSFTRD